MKKIVLALCTLSSVFAYSQEHFTGLSTSSRVGLLNAGINPAELANLSKKIEINFYGFSLNVSNNKIGYSDIVNGSNLESLIFKGADAVNMRSDVELYGPGVAVRWRKWGFGVTTKAVGRLDLVDIDTHIGDAITNNGINFSGPTVIKNDYNQRLNGTTWGEVGFSIAHTLYENDKHRFNAGVTFKMMFPGSYANMGTDKFSGTISNTATGSYMSNADATLNIAYSGNLANSFSKFNDYSQSVFGGLHGFVGDVGFNYQWKDGKKYKLNLGASVRNMGSMTFSDSNNASTYYHLSIPQATPTNPGLDLSQFQNVNSLKDVEARLLSSGYLTEISQNKDFKVKLPTLFTAYADVKIVPKLYVSVYGQQKMHSNSKNDQITAQNMITVTPRVNLGFFEAFSSWSSSEISGFNGGFGFRLGGFYLGSGSVVTALLKDSKQIDVYTGFRWAFL
ncbi:hypothetical protein [Flavobacterium aciduliphilum]|uniref:DUF5723 domain-containing protein n=1 Tax=Flavobacterium aciduliphilum TaxID=1101402 RepID=A0A328YXU6_9FLAO|nr:hypothetical protein [Flavobacterium aciduliphilum]RAR75367.1 hypothetical protein CLV55_10162 [Flavobacterium aciduliphilum]